MRAGDARRHSPFGQQAHPRRLAGAPPPSTGTSAKRDGSNSSSGSTRSSNLRQASSSSRLSKEGETVIANFQASRSASMGSLRDSGQLAKNSRMRSSSPPSATPIGYARNPGSARGVERQVSRPRATQVAAGCDNRPGARSPVVAKGSARPLSVRTFSREASNSARLQKTSESPLPSKPTNTVAIMGKLVGSQGTENHTLRSTTVEGHVQHGEQEQQSVAGEDTCAEVVKVVAGRSPRSSSPPENSLARSEARLMRTPKEVKRYSSNLPGPSSAALAADRQIEIDRTLADRGRANPGRSTKPDDWAYKVPIVGSARPSRPTGGSAVCPPGRIISNFVRSTASSSQYVAQGNREQAAAVGGAPRRSLSVSNDEPNGERRGAADGTRASGSRATINIVRRAGNTGPTVGGSLTARASPSISLGNMKATYAQRANASCGRSLINAPRTQGTGSKEYHSDEVAAQGVFQESEPEQSVHGQGQHDSKDATNDSSNQIQNGTQDVCSSHQSGDPGQTENLVKKHPVVNPPPSPCLPTKINPPGSPSQTARTSPPSPYLTARPSRSTPPTSPSLLARHVSTIGTSAPISAYLAARDRPSPPASPPARSRTSPPGSPYQPARNILAGSNVALRFTTSSSTAQTTRGQSGSSKSGSLTRPGSSPRVPSSSAGIRDLVNKLDEAMRGQERGTAGQVGRKKSSERGQNGERCDVKATQESSRSQAPVKLAVYFSSGYLAGETYEGSGYEASWDARGARILHHKATNVKVWAYALDVRSRKSEKGLTIFHYIPVDKFVQISARQIHTVKQWASKAETSGNFGFGLYGTCKEPADWASADEILMNNHWPAKQWLPEGTDSTLGLEQHMGSLVHDQVKEQFAGSANYCVPIICDLEQAYNMQRRTTPEMDASGARPGQNIFRDSEPIWRDMWVVRISSDGESSVARIVQASEDHVEIMRKQIEFTSGHGSEDHLIYINSLARLLEARERFDEAVPLFHEEIDRRREKLGATHHTTLTGINNLAKLLEARGQFNEAVPLFYKELEGWREKQGSKHPDTLSRISNLAHLLHGRGRLDDRGRLDEAEGLYREVLEGRRAELGNKHPDTLQSINNLVLLLNAQGRLEEAESLYRDTLSGWEVEWGGKPGAAA